MTRRPEFERFAELKEIPHTVAMLCDEKVRFGLMACMSPLQAEPYFLEVIVAPRGHNGAGQSGCVVIHYASGQSATFPVGNSFDCGAAVLDLDPPHYLNEALRDL